MKQDWYNNAEPGPYLGGNSAYGKRWNCAPVQTYVFFITITSAKKINLWKC